MREEDITEVGRELLNKYNCLFTFGVNPPKCDTIFLYAHKAIPEELNGLNYYKGFKVIVRKTGGKPIPVKTWTQN